MKVYASIACAEARVHGGSGIHVVDTQTTRKFIVLSLLVDILEFWNITSIPCFYLEVFEECGALSLGNGVILRPSFFFFNSSGSNFADQKSMNRTHCNGEQHFHWRERTVNFVTWGKSLSLIFVLCKHDAISVS